MHDAVPAVSHVAEQSEELEGVQFAACAPLVPSMEALVMAAKNDSDSSNEGTRDMTVTPPHEGMNGTASPKSWISQPQSLHLASCLDAQELNIYLKL